MKSFLLLSYITVGYSVTFSPVITLAQTDSNTPPTQANPTLPPISVEALPLLQSAVKLLGQTTYEVESSMDIAGKISGKLFESQAKVKTILEAPNKFKSEIAFISNDLEGKKYQVVSDGDRVWIYNLATNQYSITDYQQFIESRNGFMLGTVSYFYAKTLNDINKSPTIANTVAKLPPDRLGRYFQRLTGIDLQNAIARDETIEGTAYKVYDLDSSSKGFELTTYVNPLRGDIERVNLSGNKDGLYLAVEEQIVSQIIPQNISPDTFSFIPAEEAEEVTETIAIDPF